MAPVELIKQDAKEAVSESVERIAKTDHIVENLLQQESSKIGLKKKHKHKETCRHSQKKCNPPKSFPSQHL